MKKTRTKKIGMIEDIPILLTYKKVKNINFRLSVEALNISAPSYVSIDEILSLIDQKKISAHLEKLKSSAQKKVQNEHARSNGATPTGVLFFGKYHPIEFNHSVEQVTIKDQKLLIPLNLKDSELLIDHIDRFLKAELAHFIDARLTFWKEKAGLHPSHYSIRKMKTRWGSCTPKTGRVRFNFYLIQLPDICIDAIIIHELVHLKEANHQKGFYDLLYQYFPEYDQVHKKIKSFTTEPYLYF